MASEWGWIDGNMTGFHNRSVGADLETVILFRWQRVTQERFDMIPVLVLAGVVVIFVLWAVAAYNGLVGLREQVRAAWAQIDVVLKRRHDLIPNLVETVKGYAAHEKGTLEAVIAARNQAVSAAG